MLSFSIQHLEALLHTTIIMSKSRMKEGPIEVRKNGTSEGVVQQNMNKIALTSYQNSDLKVLNHTANT